MKNLILFALLVAAGWYGWQHRSLLTGSGTQHEAVIRNECDVAILHLRLRAGDQTLVRERIEPHATETLPFGIEGNCSFSMEWQWEGRDVTGHWDGGFFQQGPVRTRHHFAIDDGGGVAWRQEPITGPR